MWIKAGVDISRLNREIRRALSVVEKEAGLQASGLVITSTYEGNHVAGSLHYANDAFDVVFEGWGEDSAAVGLKAALGRDFDVVAEKDHVHVEYDPKTRRCCVPSISS